MLFGIMQHDPSECLSIQSMIPGMSKDRASTTVLETPPDHDMFDTKLHGLHRALWVEFNV